MAIGFVKIVMSGENLVFNLQTKMFSASQIAGFFKLQKLTINFKKIPQKLFKV